MVKKMAGPRGPGPKGVANEVGVSRSTLYRWASELDTVDIVDQPEPPAFAKSMEKMIKVKRPQDWSPEEKLAAVLEVMSLSEEDLGAYLRSRGVA